METAGRVPDGERQTQEQLLRVGTGRVYATHQAQGFPVSANQDVLAVVERMPVDFDATRTATELPRGLEHGDRHAGGAQFDGSGESGPAAADDGNLGLIQPLIHVRQAIHSLRAGVSEMRRVSVWPPLRLISSSSVR